ncbi:MAG: hypothetical protein IH984_10555 [Planctomycetes bacterium]|nr:hypothetical protein [Planctomycetota bacterium]
MNLKKIIYRLLIAILLNLAGKSIQIIHKIAKKGLICKDRDGSKPPLPELKANSAAPT